MTNSLSISIQVKRITWLLKRQERKEKHQGQDQTLWGIREDNKFNSQLKVKFTIRN